MTFFTWLIALIKAFTIPKSVPPEASKQPPEPLSPLGEPIGPSRSAKLYLEAKKWLGVDVTPGDSIPDGVACVASLQEIHRRAFGYYMGRGAALYNTAALTEWLRSSPDYSRVFNPLPGDIWIFPTGRSVFSPPPVPNGHCGVVGRKDWMSNTSANGRWEANYTQATCEAQFARKGGYPYYIFRLH